MSSTRTQIRQEAARRFGRPVFSTATGGSTTTLIDTVKLKDSAASDFTYQGQYVLMTSGDASGDVRRVSSFARTTGILTVGNAFSATIDSGDTYELHDMLDPREWAECINRGLRKCIRIRRDPLTIVDDQLQYSLASLTGLERKSQVTGVIVQHGAASQKVERSLPVYRWDIVADDDAFTLHLETAEGEDTANNRVILLEWVGPYDALATDAATTTCPLDYVVAATLDAAYEVYTQNMDRATRVEARQERAAYADDLLAAHRKYAEGRARPIGARLA